MLFILLVIHAVGGGYTFDSLPCSVKKGEITSDMCIYIYIHVHAHFMSILGSGL